MRKTLLKCGFLACATRKRAKESRRDLHRSTRSFDAMESSDDRRKPASKIFLDNFVESHLDRAVEDRIRANHRDRFAARRSMRQRATHDESGKTRRFAPAKAPRRSSRVAASNLDAPCASRSTRNGPLASSIRTEWHDRCRRVRVGDDVQVVMVIQERRAAVAVARVNRCRACAAGGR
jgi:hypothetical protein